MPTRRLFVPSLTPGRVVVDADEAHHARNVLRLEVGATVELFDATGQAASARVTSVEPQFACEVTEVRRASPRVQVHVASAVPKGDRADWMVEKLSELGVTSWTPLRTARSVVHPSGTGKLDRWKRIAVESAKQSRRAGVMEVRELADSGNLVFGQAFVLSTREGSKALGAMIEAEDREGEAPAEPMRMRESEASVVAHPHGSAGASPSHQITLLIGPEGGWTDEELSSFASRGVVEASLTDTILRIETAAVVAAAIVVTRLSEDPS